MLKMFFLVVFCLLISLGYSLQDPKEPMPGCSPSPVCPRLLIYDKYEVCLGCAMSNSKYKILMELTPKASCTTAVIMFLKSMGFEHNVHYFGWPHDFRFEYFYQKCGTVSPCMYEDDSWIRFKIVRNPFDRVVSSYLHVMKNRMFFDSLFHRDEVLESLYTFENFVQLLHNFRSKYAMLNLASGHFKLQASEYELEYYLKHNKSLFDVIIPVENPRQGIEKLNNLIRERIQPHENWDYSIETASEVSPKPNSSYPLFQLEAIPENIKHYITRKETANDSYVGNLPWRNLKHRVPGTYQPFFNPTIISMVQKIYADDLFLYNYTYPFSN